MHPGKIWLWSREEQPMTSFSEEEAATCMSCDEKPPEFRLIRLGKYLGKK
jgi:hypothetical protein